MDVKRNKLEKIYFKGTREDWDGILPTDAGYPTSVTVYYYAENGESMPDDGGNYWRFAPDGKTPEVWKQKDDNL